LEVGHAKPVAILSLAKTKGDKAIPVTGPGGSFVSERLRLSHFLDKQLTDGGEVVSLYPQEDSWHSFLLEAYKLLII
jgi:hypothetical protein